MAESAPIGRHRGNGSLVLCDFGAIRILAAFSHYDDAMIRRTTKAMTVRQLKRSMDRRFDRLDRRKADKSDLDKKVTELRAEIATLGTDLRREIGELRTELRGEIAASAADTRRHMDVIAESLRDDLRIFAEAIGLHSDRLNRHDVRLDRLEQRSI